MISEWICILCLSRNELERRREHESRGYISGLTLELEAQIFYQYEANDRICGSGIVINLKFTSLLLRLLLIVRADSSVNLVAVVMILEEAT